MAKILLVDDDKNSINLYKQLLESHNHNIETANDGEEGLQKIKDNLYDLVLLDVMLPKMDGISVLANLENDIKKQKIVLLTNLTHNSSLDEATKLGAIDHIDKATISPEDFIEKIESLI